MTSSQRIGRVSRRLGLRAAGGAAAMAGVGLALAGAPSRSAEASHSHIEGVWLVSFQASNRPDHLRIWFFFPGGILLALDTPQSISTDLEDHPDTLDHQAGGGGQWTQVGPEEFRYAYVEIDHDAAGNPTALERTSGTIRLSPATDTFQGDFELVERSFAGAVRSTRNIPLIRGERVTID